VLLEKQVELLRGRKDTLTSWRPYKMKGIHEVTTALRNLTLKISPHLHDCASKHRSVVATPAVKDIMIVPGLWGRIHQM
jgi:hypothetical protein